MLKDSNRILLHRKTVEGFLSFFLVCVSVVVVLWNVEVIDMYWWPLIGASTGALIGYPSLTRGR